MFGAVLKKLQPDEREQNQSSWKPECLSGNRLLVKEQQILPILLKNRTGELFSLDFEPLIYVRNCCCSGTLAATPQMPHNKR
jgi:hypothetical protein